MSVPEPDPASVPPLNWEGDRLETFYALRFPAWANVSPEKLAKAGFFYTGNEDEVECFACAGRITGWQLNDQAILRHRQTFPDCPFVLNPLACGNVPLAVQRRNTLNTIRSAVVDLSCDRARAGSSRVEEPTIPERGSTSVREEGGRLMTFRNWPKPTIVSPADLARAGFFFTGRSDTVQCAFCGGRLEQWQAGDIPSHEHRTHFPQCPFVVGTGERTPNYEITPDPAVMRDAPDTRPVTANFPSILPNLGVSPEDPDSLATRLKEMGVYFQNPVSSHMMTFQARIQTFTDWPKDKKQRPDDLAAAGFFYVGVDDNVKCFHCDGGLKNWLPEDCVFREHARWYPECDYVALCKGESFVRSSSQSPLCTPSSPPASTSPNKPVDASDKDRSNSEKDLEQENRFLKEQRTCKICMDAEVGVVILPCGHLCCCPVCAPPLKHCPICRKETKGLVRTYFS